MIKKIYEMAVGLLVVLPGVIVALFGAFLIGIFNPEVARDLERLAVKLGEHIKELEAKYCERSS